MEIVTLAVLLVSVLGAFAVSRYLGRSSQIDEGYHPLLDLKESWKLAESARLKILRNAYKDALKDVDDALELDADSLYLFWMRADIYLKMEEYHAVLSDCDRMVAKDSQYFWAYYQRGMAYLGIKKLGEAKTAFEQTIRIRSDYYEAYFGILEIELLSQSEDGIHKIVERILSISQDNLFNLTRIISLLQASHRLPDIIRYTSRILEMNYVINSIPPRERTWFYTTRIWAYINTGDTDKAIQDLTFIISQTPNEPSFYEIRGQIYSYLNQDERALADLNKAVEIKPERANSYVQRGRIFEDLQDFESAVKDYNQAIKLDVGNSSVYLSRASIHNQLKHYEAAIQDCDKALELKPDYGDAYNNRAWIKLHISDYTGALDDAEKAVKLDSGKPNFFGTHGNAKWHLGNYEAALLDFEQAIELAEDKTVYLVEKALTLHKLNRQDEAIALWREVQAKEAISAQELQDEYDFAPPFFEALLELERLSAAS